MTDTTPHLVLVLSDLHFGKLTHKGPGLDAFDLEQFVDYGRPFYDNNHGDRDDHTTATTTRTTTTTTAAITTNTIATTTITPTDTNHHHHHNDHKLEPTQRRQNDTSEINDEYAIAKSLDSKIVIPRGLLVQTGSNFRYPFYRNCDLGSPAAPTAKSDSNNSNCQDDHIDSDSHNDGDDRTTPTTITQT